MRTAAGITISKIISIALITVLVVGASPKAWASAVLEAANSEYFSSATVPVSAYPFTFACWAKFNDVTANRAVMWQGDKDVTTSGDLLQGSGGGAGDRVVAQSRDATGAYAGPQTSTGYTSATWHHVAAVFTAAQERHVYLDGGNEGTDTTNSRTPTDYDRFELGRLGGSSPANLFDGKLAHCAVWDIALSDADVALLGGGDNPLAVQAADLIAYWPLLADAGDDKGSNTLTANGTISFDGADNPTVDGPPSSRRPIPPIIFP